MKSHQEVLDMLLEIHQEIKKQIPHPANRFDDLECVPKETDLDEAILKLKANQNFIFSQFIEYEIYKLLNARLNLSMQKKDKSHVSELSELDWVQLQEDLLENNSRLCTKLTRTLKHIYPNKVIDAAGIENDIKERILRVRRGESLSINSEMTQRIEDSHKLAEHRDICEGQFRIPSYLYVDKIRGKEKLETAKKIMHFWRGVYFSNPAIHVGFCDEHACLALVKILEKDLSFLFSGILEKVSVDYGDGVNHTFIVYRDKKSTLEDMSTWGENAFLFDSWNDLVCFAKDYQSLPVCYPLLHKNGKWTSIQFETSDWYLLKNITTLQTYWTITGNESLKTRLPLIMEEYQLTSLASPEFAETKSFLTSLMHELQPDNFVADIEFFITTSNNNLVSVINGFDVPKIAIHRELLCKIPQQFSVDELRFGVARALLQIKYHGGVSNDDISAEEHHYLDGLALAKCKHADAAIGYLRKANQFCKKNSAGKVLEIIEPGTRLSILTKWTYEQRIKNLMTLLAKDESLRVNMSAKEDIPTNIVSELQSIKQAVFFSEKFIECKTKVEKINVLTTCLPDLKIELLPYEFVYAPGIRVRHFCCLIKRIGIDFRDRAQAHAVNALISRAFELRIPAFEYIYFSIFDPKFRQEKKIVALGPFRELQLAINRFINAKNAEEAEKAAGEVNSFKKLLKNHFRGFGKAHNKLFAYKKSHQQSLPTGDARYFGSEIGESIAWTSFTKNNHHLPWEFHVKWALQSKSPAMANVLWWIGVTRETRIWPKLGANTLLKLVKKAPIVKLSGELAPYSHVSFKQDKTFNYKTFIMRYLSQRHNLVTDMFVPSGPTKEALNNFFRVNLPALAAPGLDKTMNLDNPSVRFLLGLFAKMAQGSEEEKNSVKDFFLNKESEFNLMQLGRIPSYEYNPFNYNVPYVQFVVQQKFQDIQFNLFTPDEIIQFIRTYTKDGDVPLSVYLSLYKLPFTTFSLPCITQLLPLMEKSYLSFDACRILASHLQENDYYFFSATTEKILKLTFDTLCQYRYRRHIIKHLSWDSQISEAKLEAIPYSTLMTIYRSYDTTLSFPNQEQQARLRDVLLKKIEQIHDVNERIRVLEELLYSNEKYSPVNDPELRARAINLLVEAFSLLYGKDDGSETYFNTIKPAIDSVLKKASRQDKYAILSKLTVRIESQTRVNELVGMHFEPEKHYLVSDKKISSSSVIAALAKLCQQLSNHDEDRRQFLEFISSPLTDRSVQLFSKYLSAHQKIESLIDFAHYDFRSNPEVMDREKEKRTAIIYAIKNFYYEFWDFSIYQRAVVIDYLLMPTKTVESDASSQTAYKKAFTYVANKLFPNVSSDSDENFALALLQSYLDSADPYERSYLLSAMLVASNDSRDSSKRVGKKLAMICEHMGPPYIKLLQAIHSHPNTPAHIRDDLKHAKNHANPPDRWELERLINETLPAKERARIKRIGRLLGSASYNLALEVILQNDEHVVLSLCRENATNESQKGFRHLATTIQNCKHPLMDEIRDLGLATLKESEKLSELEMDTQASVKQFEIARRIYTFNMDVTVKDITFAIQMKPVSLLSNGKGYRFIELARGVEFNEFDKLSPQNILIRKAVAKAVLIKELVNIASGDHFDSDRHGNQMRVLVNPVTDEIILDAYDFGEVSLEKPDESELKMLADFIRDLPYVVMKNMFFSSSVDSLLSTHIEKAIKNGQSPQFLMRIRKAFLALQDFQGDLSMLELIEVIKYVYEKQKIHPVIHAAITDCTGFISSAEKILKTAEKLMSPFRFFSRTTVVSDTAIPLQVFKPS
ncbi:hypothetical protein [Legionella hackeliae]|uniref:Uncharacterized protein n=1 Tax=Legionella hackeliae TaxID=449 RepID=A0A0A8UKG1_LEGHA|nr:hypothetical protein [Legionella hackeliae]KTD13515.1 hypothetical protein Lhac_0899 [Legionella hackeliae]CEK09360.1 protein of unknown function [Legionella hackeliae]STX49268.1 2-polyprenylphenol 6-hydroxylase [Legionella hackeliae]